MEPVVKSAADKTTHHADVVANYTLKIGEYLASEVPSVKKKVTKSGLIPVVLDGLKQERQVFRLWVGAYKDRSSASQAVEPLQKKHIKSFILKNSARRYNAYAGSFFSLESAEIEQKRLAAKGVTVELKKTSVSLPAFLLTAGSFTTRDAAMESAKKLEQQGLAVEILQS